MEQFRKKTAHFASSDEGVKVAELITLVDNNPLAKEILKLLDVKSILGEIIQIPGSRDLVKIQNAINQKYHKEDLESDLNSISLYSGEDFTINFNALEQNKYFVSLGTKQINTVPIYSATNDFFSELYQMEKYASKLIKDGYKDIVEANLRMLKGIQTLTKNAGTTERDGRNDAKRLCTNVVTVSDEVKPKKRKMQGKAEYSRRTVCKSLPKKM